MNRLYWVAAAVGLLTSLASAGTISYTCDPTVSSLDGSGVCAYLDTTVANFYGSTFTNANASLYITTSTSGLGSSNQEIETIPYSTYFSYLAAESTDGTASLYSLSATEPAIFGGGNVGVTSALAQALGIPGPYAGIYENPSNSSDPKNGTVCILPATNCFNGVIAVVTPAALAASPGGERGLWFRDVAGTGLVGRSLAAISIISALWSMRPTKCSGLSPAATSEPAHPPPTIVAAPPQSTFFAIPVPALASMTP